MLSDKTNGLTNETINRGGIIDEKIFMALCMLILLFIAACSTNKSHKPSENMPAVSETNSTAPKSGEGENIYFGTINTIVGNELKWRWQSCRNGHRKMRKVVKKAVKAAVRGILRRMKGQAVHYLIYQKEEVGDAAASDDGWSKSSVGLDD